MKLQITSAFLVAASVCLCSGPGLHAHPQSLKFPQAADMNAVGKRDLGMGVNFYSLGKEKEIGKQLALETERAGRLIDDSVVNAYMNALAQKLAGNSDARMPITVRVLDSEMADGFALPGGFLYVDKGLILEAKTEAELAGAIAHSIAHTAMRSATALATKGAVMRLASIPAMASPPQASMTIFSTPSISPMNSPEILLTLKYQAEYVLAADYFSLQYLYKSGYDPEPFVQLVERAAAKNGLDKNGRAMKGLYPSGSERADKMRKEIASILPPREGATVSTSEFDSLKERIRSLVPDRSKPSLRRRGEQTMPPAQLQIPQ
jgi:predicted Zn-dependent protease